MAFADGTRETVSIVIPSRNRGLLLPETLESVRSQSSEDWECLVVDDQSTDDTVAYVTEIASRDPRFRLIHSTFHPSNANTSRNLGLKAATGTYIIFLDSDDLLPRDRVERSLAVFREHPDLEAVVFDCGLFLHKPDDLKLRYNRSDFSDVLLAFINHDLPWNTTSPTWRCLTLKEAGGWDADVLRQQDWMLHVRMLCRNPHGLRYLRVPEMGYWYRIHPHSMGAEPLSFEMMEHCTFTAFRAVSCVDAFAAAKPCHRSAANGRAFHWVRTLIVHGSLKRALRQWFKGFRVKGIQKLKWMLSSLELIRLVTLAFIQKLLQKALAFKGHKHLWPHSSAYESTTLCRTPAPHHASDA